jgi:hypothetical protein
MEKIVDNLSELTNINLKVKRIILDYSMVLYFKKTYPILHRKRLIKEQQEEINKVYDNNYFNLYNQYIKIKEHIEVISILVKTEIILQLQEMFKCNISFIKHDFNDNKLHMYLDDYNVLIKKGKIVIFSFTSPGYEKIIKYLYFINHDGELNIFINKNSMIHIDEVKKELLTHVEGKVKLNIDYC